MKFSVSSYSFQQMINRGELNQFSCIDKAAELGFDAIEFIDLQPHDGSSKKEYAVKLREEAARQGIVISCYTVGADFLHGSGADIAAEIERVKAEVDIAETLGVSRMRHDATVGDPVGTRPARSFDMVLERLADGCREVTRYAQTKGVKTMVENHGFFCQDSSRVEKLVTAVNHENFGLLTDMGNFTCADEDPALACAITAPYTFYVHAKDFHIKGADEAPGSGFFRSRGGRNLRGAIIGHGNVPVRQCLYVLKRCGYDDTISVEFEGLEDCISGIKIGLENLKTYWNMV